ncbi:MAG: hypothetical protein Kow0042_06140 [Calditrichia bacterium]
MIKLRKPTIHDRLQIYEILQQNEMFLAEDIQTAMERVDSFLFDKKVKQFQIIVAADGKTEKILGYACFGPDPSVSGSFQLFRLAVSPLAQDQPIEETLLRAVEKEVLRKKGQSIICKIPSHGKYHRLKKFYLQNNFKKQRVIKSYYPSGVDQIILIKNLEMVDSLSAFRSNFGE